MIVKGREKETGLQPTSRKRKRSFSRERILIPVPSAYSVELPRTAPSFSTTTITTPPFSQLLYYTRLNTKPIVCSISFSPHDILSKKFLTLFRLDQQPSREVEKWLARGHTAGRHWTLPFLFQKPVSQIILHMLSQAQCLYSHRSLIFMLPFRV